MPSFYPYDLAYLAQQAADLAAVIVALEAAGMDATTYRRALRSVERMIDEQEE